MTIETAIDTAIDTTTGNCLGVENTITYADIKPVLAKWWRAPEEDIKTNIQQIIQELAMICGGQQNIGNITVFLAGRALSGCKLSKFILDDLTDTAEKTVRHGRFAKEVKARDGGRCVLTGNRMGIQAAHILDFALCMTDAERYDINNGLTLDMKIHHFWDTGLIICEPDCDTNTARFRISKFMGLDSEDRAEIQYALKSATSDCEVSIPVSEEMMVYISKRYEIDCDRFGGC